MSIERNQAMVAMYADGDTLEVIGARYGVTRERVRQIIKKIGGADAEVARAQRVARREASDEIARKEFLLKHETLASALADAGLSRPETVRRIVLFYPGTEVAVAEDALRESKLVFEHEGGDDHFSDAALEAGLWYLLADDLGVKPDPDWAAANLAGDLVDEVDAVLSSVEVTPQDVATILAMIGAAQEHALGDPAVTITGARYEQLRSELVTAFGLESKKGSKIWPPSRQTLMKRFGGWNETLERAGLATSAKGRQKGLLRYTQLEYAQAVSEYVATADRDPHRITYAGYEAWVRSEGDAGRDRPSGPSVRNYFGSWFDAVRAALRGTV